MLSECIIIASMLLIASPSLYMASTRVSALITLPAPDTALTSLTFPDMLAAANVPVRIDRARFWRVLAHQPATRSPIAAIGSSPAKARARSLLPQALPRACTTAISCPVVIGLTVRGELSLSSSASPVKSCQNGILTVLPPRAPLIFMSGTGARMPDCMRADNCAVRSIMYGVKTSGTITSDIRVAAIAANSYKKSLRLPLLPSI